MKRNVFFLLTSVTFIGLILRIYNLSSIPAGFFCDEASTGYNAYLLLNTGRDEFGKQFPVFFESFGNFRPGVPFYVTIPFVALFGLSEFSTRLPAALIGTATIVGLFFLVRLLFGSEKIALLSATLLAIAPWHIHFSRYGAENIYLPLFAVLGSFLLLEGVKKKNNKIFLVSFIVFGIGLYTYFQAFFLIPLFLAFLLISKRKLLEKKYIIIGILVFTILSLPLIFGIKSGEILGRFTQVSSANKEKDLATITQGMAVTYKDHFLPEFLFSKGDIGYHTHFITRFSVKGMGQLYWFQLPFILLSFLLFKKNKSSFYFLLFWILVYPVGSTIAPFADGGGPFATRSIIGVIPFQILTALGIVAFLSFITKRKVKIITATILTLVIGYSFKLYFTEYFTRYPIYSSNFWGWQYGAREIVNYFEEHENEYDHLYMAPEFNAPDIFLKFYSPQNCHKCAVGLPKDFMNQKGKTLFAVTPAYLSQNPDINFLTIKEVKYPKGGVAFKIGTIVK